MKTFSKKYLDFIIYTICGLLFVISSYNIIINIHHYRHLNKTVTVSDIDKNYNDFKDNVLKIETKIAKISKNGMYSDFSFVLNKLKSDGLYRLMPSQKLHFTDLYQLNNYFVDTLINEGWIKRLKNDSGNSYYDEFMETLINNSNYVKKELLNNCNFSYDMRNDIRSTINEEYQFIVNNYKVYSFIVLSMLNDLGDNYG